MKKLTLWALIFTLLMGGCADNNLDYTNLANDNLPDLTAGFAEEATKTYVENDKYLRWHEVDLITAFYGNALNRQYKFNGATGANNGTFSLVPSGELGTGNTLDAIYAVYPYDETASISDEGVISLTLPAIQQYAENSFGKDANTMIAVTENIEDTFLGFKNACGYLKLKLYNAEGVRISSLEVKGNNEEKIAGPATATIEYGGVPSIVMNESATTAITLDCGEEGVALGTTVETATEFWIVLPETSFENGITISVTDMGGGKFFKTTEKRVNIIRNNIQPMATTECIMGEGPESWRIYYTTHSGNTIQTYKSDFRSHVVSNTYENGQGVMKFDYELETIPSSAFAYQKDLKSIILPESITHIGARAFFNGYDCLEAIYVKAITPPTVEECALQWQYTEYSGYSIYTKCTIYVPEESVEEYKAADYWNYYYENKIQGYKFADQ